MEVVQINQLSGAERQLVYTHRHEALGNRIRWTLSIEALRAYVGKENFIIYKGAALDPLLYNKNAQFRLFRDIDVWIPEGVLESNKNILPEGLRWEKGKLVFEAGCCDIPVKSVFDIKTGSMLEEYIPMDEVYCRRLKALSWGQEFCAPSWEDHVLILLAHHWKHIQKGHEYKNFEADWKLLKKMDINWDMVEKNAERWGLEGAWKHVKETENQ